MFSVFSFLSQHIVKIWEKVILSLHMIMVYNAWGAMQHLQISWALEGRLDFELKALKFPSFEQISQSAGLYQFLSQVFKLK